MLWTNVFSHKPHCTQFEAAEEVLRIAVHIKYSVKAAAFPSEYNLLYAAKVPGISTFLGQGIQ